MVRLTDLFDMTKAVDWDFKAKIKQKYVVVSVSFQINDFTDEPLHVISNNVEFDKCSLRQACASSF